MAWVDHLRTALLISLSLLFMAMIFRRFKRKAMNEERPVASHAELLALHVEYHPERIRIEVLLPGPEEVRPAMLDKGQQPFHIWPAISKEEGRHVLELPIGPAPDGEYYFELATSSQRTVRKFRLKRA
jgi:hypothetical protein